MIIIKGSLTVVYDPPFYKGIFEEETQYSYRVAQINFGTALPKTRLIYLYVTEHYADLVFYEQRQNIGFILQHKNPKRLQRLARKSVKTDFKGTKAQQALQRQQQNRKKRSKKQLAVINKNNELLQYKKKKAKRLQKHKGH
ncbi:hypothetical protein JCM15457_589 [Liquorilactobacillus sucicola DSM 21376 = JCM 15457]|uniref:DUF2992 domain-containing protein n=1 Tax=Liquorilactobacillus sucicola DSM 21376 = JCM 15457 TaxID=1423806 RepID=A0A023CVW9_9LACO|nr:DUF2992 family protein [Liquorilactobacillus sucicola]KRN05626.1 hypothetical protein FD15_GL002189 [Liquorilactobacillus sucicola DSM 21376 = JCM 15457]GAJ25711.1 hypothetical protein JCM15457_589 [Liquorilactobacillus sucicola DSM 21376 = JCM 15457]